MKGRPAVPRKVVNLKNIPGLNRIEERRTACISAAATCGVADSPVVGSAWGRPSDRGEERGDPNLRNTRPPLPETSARTSAAGITAIPTFWAGRSTSPERAATFALR